jgi:hypothetical protein
MNANKLGLLALGVCRRNSAANASETLPQLSKDNQLNNQTIIGQNRPSQYWLVQKESSG